MGIGMVMIVAPAAADQVRHAISEETWVIGRITTGEKKVRLV
jgi:phosphoribosylaminoimidazole (AIR) synthetase